MAFIGTPVAPRTRVQGPLGAKRCVRRYARPPCTRHGLARMSASSGSSTEFNYRPDVTKELGNAVRDLKSRLKRCSLYFVGPMGSGKSVIGKFIAQQLSFRFLDTDALIEGVTKRSISELFADEGEAAFRDLEAAVLDQVQAFLNCVVATGGGIVLRDTNWGKLQTGIVVFLDVPIDILVKRLEGDTTRPLLKDGDLREKLEAIMASRRSLYELADVTVNVNEGDALDNVALEVCRKVSNFIKENPPKMSALYSSNLNEKDGK